MQLSTIVGAAAKKYAVPPKQDDVNVISICDSRGSMECMIVEGYIAGHKARILIDSGAKMSHISCSFVNKHQLSTSTHSIPTLLVMADGHKQVTERVVSNAKLQLNNVSENIDMLVMNMTQYDAILGMSWHFAHYPVTYDKDTVTYTHDGVTHTVRRDNNAYHSIKSKHFISAIALSRMIRNSTSRAAGSVE